MHTITKAISEYVTEMLTIRVLKGIVQISTINNFTKHSLAYPVLTTSGVKEHKTLTHKGKLQMVNLVLSPTLKNKYGL